MTKRFLPSFLIGYSVLAASCGQWEKKARDKSDLVEESQNEENSPFLETPTKPEALKNAEDHDSRPNQTQPEQNDSTLAEPPPPPPEPEGTLVVETKHALTLEEWINHRDNHEILGKIGTFDSNQRTLTLHGHTTFSFSRFTVGSPLVIETRGFNVTLVGADFTNLEIKTAKPRDNSGHVRIYSTSKTLPKINTSGSPGTDGEDGRCPNGQKCVLLSDKLTKTSLSEVFPTATTKEHSKTLDWSDPQVPEEWRQRTKENIQQEDVNSASRFCDPGTPIISLEQLSVTGLLKFTQRLMHFSLPADTIFPEPIHAKLYEAKSGSDGYNGGNVSIIQLGKMNEGELKKITANGGAEGKGGLNVKRPPSAARSQQTYSTIKITENIKFDGLKISWTLYCRPVIRSFPPKGGWKDVPAQFLAREAYVPTNDFFEKHSVNVPAVAAGEDLPDTLQMSAASGRAGVKGQVEIIEIGTHQEWKAAVHSSIPLPKGCLNY